MNSVKFQIQKSIVFLYTNNELSEREIKKTIPFKIASKGIKYWEIRLIKEVKDMYTKNCKTLTREIEDTNKWKDILCSRTERINKGSLKTLCLHRHQGGALQQQKDDACWRLREWLAFFRNKVCKFRVITPFFRQYYCILNRLQYSVNITFTLKT